MSKMIKVPEDVFCAMFRLSNSVLDLPFKDFDYPADAGCCRQCADAALVADFCKDYMDKQLKRLAYIENLTEDYRLFHC